jgi:hypothetical protein
MMYLRDCLLGPEAGGVAVDGEPKYYYYNAQLFVDTSKAAVSDSSG